MSIFANLKEHDDIKDTTDTLGGGYQPLASGVYDAIINYAYLKTAKSGAKAISFEFDVDGKTVNEDIYVTNRNGENFYTKDGEKHYLIGFTHVNDIALFTAQKPLSELDTEKKVIKLYNFDQRKEVDTQVDMLMDIVKKPIKLGIIKEIRPKQVKQGDEYVDDPNGATVERNNVSKVFSPKDGRTVNEVKAKADTAEFIKKWEEKWTGVDKEVKSTAVTKPQAKAVKSLFS
ncbi:hypothetical protein MOMA_06941 [Moraxella macacae 0408225]|uniref:Single-stranded DNA-binding protein n=1 Tax=Moraxella macacae 0408225 TaxID=1230338 RepID=L2F744_9GAMM|nr:hypothetical protein [Moraxella macacae]ELA08278.1 hypothetical protein MOMA_06941 [Moraxella macacae 0408225]